MSDHQKALIIRCAERAEFFLWEANSAAQRGDFAHAAALADFAEANSAIAFSVAK